MFNTVHPNRWLFWCIAIGIIVALIVSWQIELFSLDMEREQIEQRSEKENGDVSPTPTEEPFLGGDRDVHGCIGSAGYSWCEDKQKCLREWEEPCAAAPVPETQNSAQNIYRNEELGFEITLGPGYDGYRAEVTKNETGYVVRFILDADEQLWASGEFTVFLLMVYDIDWWNENAIVDESGWVYDKKYPDDLSSGKFVAKNDTYAVVWARGHDCPEGLLCKLFGEVATTASTLKFVK